MGIAGSDMYGSPKRIKDFIYKCSMKFGNDLIINSLGGRSVANGYVKKFALEFDATYKEYNQANTPQTLYSTEEPKYYSRQFHPSHEYDTFKKLIWNSDIIFIFLDENDMLNKKWKTLEKMSKKYKKPLKFII